jgi:integrase
LDEYWTPEEDTPLARTLRDANLETRAARSRLKARGKPYYRALESGLHLGYRRPQTGAGKWLARHYVGGQAYELETLAIADDFSDADGVAVLNYRQAQAKARERMVARAHHAAGKHGPLTVADAIEAYLEFLDAHRKTGYHARHRARAHILPALGDIEVQALTTEQLRKWHAELARTPARARTAPGAKQQHRKPDHSADGIRRRRVSANAILTILKAALNFAWREGRTPSDAAWRQVRPFEGVDAARVGYLTLAECKRLINAADPDFRKLVQAALQTGCRYGELCRLAVADFDADNGTLAIRITKSGRSRHVALTDEGVTLFREWCAGRAGNEILFLRADGKPWRISQQQGPMQKACERARIVPVVSFHILRHTHGSMLAMRGVPMGVIAEQLGHSNSRVTEKHYAHLAPSYVADTVRANAPRFGIALERKVSPLHRGRANA